MVRKKAKPSSRGDLDIDPDVAPVANGTQAEQEVYVILSSDSGDDSSDKSMGDVRFPRSIRVPDIKPQVKRGRNTGGAAVKSRQSSIAHAASRPIAGTRGSAAVNQVVVIDSSDSSSDEHCLVVSETASIVKQIWSFANLSFEHEDFSFLQKHFNPSKFCIAFVVVDVHSHLLPSMQVDALGYSFGILCNTRQRPRGSNRLDFVMNSTIGAFEEFSLAFRSIHSELSADTSTCLGRGLLVFEHGIWSSESSRFIFPLVLNPDELLLAPAASRKCLLRVMSEYRPHLFFESDEENSRPLPVDQILEFICRRPEEHIEPPAQFVTSENIPGIVTSLKGYQREAVAWARCIEAGTAPPYSIRDLVALPVECSITRRELMFDPVLCEIAAPVSDSESFRVSGGMICDEMGLGKTLECLALVMLTRNSRRRSCIMPSVDLLAPQSQSPKPETLHRCTCGQNDVCNIDAVQCENCLYWLHSKCVEAFDPDLPYFCLSCRTHVRTPLESDCTLIISPSSICSQVGTKPLYSIAKYLLFCCVSRSIFFAVEG